MSAIVRLAHTSALTPDELKAARALLSDVFDDMSEADWEQPEQVTRKIHAPG